MNKIYWCLAIISLLIFPLGCNDESSENNIISFSLAEQTGPALIDQSNHTVLAEVYSGTDLTQLAPEIEVSSKADVNPESGKVVDFTSGPVVYTVTAEDGSKQNWTVVVVIQNSSAAEILTFSLADEKTNAIIGDSTVEIEIYNDADITHQIPIITISPDATIEPASGDTVDFTSGDTSNINSGTVIFTVTAEDGSHKNWYVTVLRQDCYFKTINSFIIPGQVGETSIGISSINLTVPFGTDLTSVSPVIEVSPYATISPASGQPVDFSDGYEVYIVTAENGTTKSYTVNVYYAALPPNNTNIQYCGRIDFSNSLQPKYWAPGVYVKFKYEGTGCEIVIGDEQKWGSNHNILHVVIDDTIEQRIKLSSSVNNIKIGTGLPQGEHTVLVSKATEANIGYIQFLGVRCQSFLSLDPLPTRKIEFIGNSITAGTGIDVSQVACDAGDWYDQMNAYLTYGAITARTLNAQYHITAVGGIGLTQSCCGMGFTMPQVFGKINLHDPNSANWDFSKYVPDVVTVCLGQNDGVIDSATFCSAYVSFIGQIRSAYPSAKIVLLTSPMADSALLPFMKSSITGVVNYMNTHGDTNVSKYFYSTSYTSGCGYHPNKAEHVLLADELTAYLETLMGW
jgi:hypothetical protein